MCICTYVFTLCMCVADSIPTPAIDNTDPNEEIYKLSNGDSIVIPWTRTGHAHPSTAPPPPPPPDTSSSYYSSWTSYLPSLGLGQYLPTIGSHNHMELHNVRAVFQVISPQCAKVGVVGGLYCCVCLGVYMFT